MPFDDYKRELGQEISEFKEFVQRAQDGLCSNQEIEDSIKKISACNEKVRSTLSELDTALETMKSGAEEAKVNLIEEFGSSQQIEEYVSFLMNAMNTLMHFLDELDCLIPGKRNFDKNLCFSNIRFLLKKKPQVKIGQIEKEAGIRLGYMSRLEKEGNTSEPSVEFVVTAAKLLNISIDTLVSINISGLSNNEQYLMRVFDKLKLDTLVDKLEWNVESEDFLNYHIETDINGNTGHPLFELRTFYEKSEIEYPNEVTRIIFDSKSFGTNTFIKDDCYNLRLKNGTMLYLMNICKNATDKHDSAASAIEAWTFVPGNSATPLLTSLDDTPIAPMVETLYDIVKDQMSHIRINKRAIPALNAFLKNDLTDDPFDFNNDDIPF